MTQALPTLIAHRGASQHAPENTLAAFNLAWEHGADGVEGDFRLTADGHVVCVHDADLQRVGGSDLVVAESTLSELQAIDVGSWKNPSFHAERMPTLEDVLATLPEGGKLFIEVKAGPEIVPVLARSLAITGALPSSITVIAFSEDVIAACVDLLSGVEACWITAYKETDRGWVPGTVEVVTTLVSLDASGLDCEAHDCITPDFVSALRDARQSFHVWTVDDVGIARRFWDLGVDSITTNRPKELREELLSLGLH